MEKKINVVKIIWLIVQISYMLAIIYSIIETILIRDTFNSNIVTIAKCLLAMLIMFVPYFIEKRFHFSLPNYIKIAFYVFLFGCIIFGEVFEFYYILPHWDSLLHIFSGVLIGLIGLLIIEKQKFKIDTNNPFAYTFIFCFSVALGVVWEFYEFTCDSLLNLNLQRYLTLDGTPLIGRLALIDTMKDLICDVVGVLMLIVYMYIKFKKKQPQEILEEKIKTFV